MRLRFLFRAFRARYRDQRQEIAEILAVLRPGDFAADIGAHKGSYTCWMRHAVGPTGKVIAFEPQAGLAAYLEAACAAMRWSNVRILGCALSDRPGAATLHIPGIGPSPGASLERSTDSAAPGRQQTCPVETLDHVLENETAPALLKIDVEGHELRVLRGAERTIAQHKPVILFECEARHLADVTMEQVFAFLRERGYTGRFFSPGGLRPVSEFDPAVHQASGPARFWEAPGYCNNFVFKPVGKS